MSFLRYLAMNQTNLQCSQLVKEDTWATTAVHSEWQLTTLDPGRFLSHVISAFRGAKLFSFFFFQLHDHCALCSCSIKTL